MISLTCTNCKMVLSIDDAFAGGVCRCQHCGTIQTVPSRLKSSGGEGESAPAPPPGKSLYQHRARSDAGTGLDDLAEMVSSSGISSSGLAAQRGKSKQQIVVARTNRTQSLLAAAGAVILLLIGAVVWLASQRAAPPTGDTAVEAPAQPRQPSEPMFLDIALEGKTIVYVLDRGGSAQKSFGDLKQATLRSLATLGPDRKFQIVFWNNGTDEAFPSGSATYATRPNLEAARRALEGVAAFGASDAESAMKKAISAKPSDIILATAKGWDLDESFVEMILNLRQGSDARIHVIAIGGGSALEPVAEKTGGKFVEITESEMRQRE